MHVTVVTVYPASDVLMVIFFSIVAVSISFYFFVTFCVMS